MNTDNKKEQTEQCTIPSVSGSDLKTKILNDIKLSCDGTFSNDTKDWDMIDPVSELIERINNTIDHHYH